jgi:YHS domain-containing protein
MKLLYALFAITILGALPALAGNGKLKPQTKCPIMGGAINKALYADVEGQRIYVCCKGCIAAIKKNPDQALATLQKNGEHAKSLQTTCPIMGKPISKKLYVEYQGRRVYVCCHHCLKMARKDPAKYAKLVAEQAKQTE